MGLDFHLSTKHAYTVKKLKRKLEVKLRTIILELVHDLKILEAINGYCKICHWVKHRDTTGSMSYPLMAPKVELFSNVLVMDSVRPILLEPAV